MKSTAITMLLLCATAFVPAHAATVDLYQYGWSEGGPLTITFTAEDLDASGAFELPEVTAFEAAFVLPAGGKAILNLADVLDSGEFYFADTTDYFIRAFNLEYGVHTTANPSMPLLALFSYDFGSSIAITDQPLRTEAVPEPASYMLVGAPLAALLGFRRAFASRLCRAHRSAGNRVPCAGR